MGSFDFGILWKCCHEDQVLQPVCSRGEYKGTANTKRVLSDRFQVGETENLGRPRRNWCFLYKWHAISEGQGGIFCPPFCYGNNSLHKHQPAMKLSSHIWKWMIGVATLLTLTYNKLACAASAWERNTWSCHQQPSSTRGPEIFSSCQHRGSSILSRKVK